MSVIEIITDSSINTTTDVGIVNLTQTEPLLCGFITIDTGNVYDLISSACNCFYSDIFPPLFIHDEYDEEIIKKFIKRQKYANEHISENPWAVLLLDDCTEDKKIFSSKWQQSLFKNGRHWKLLYILSLQHATDIPPAIRTNVDGVFIFRETNENNLKNIYLNYAGVIPKF